MPRGIFISLPVTDVARSTAFYEAIGFSKNPRFSSEQGASMKWSEDVTVMLLDKSVYQTLTPKRIIDAHTTSGALFALPLDSREAVDAITHAAIAAGGREAHGAEDHGFMYSRGFEDPDGHGFGSVWMNADEGGSATAETEAA